MLKKIILFVSVLSATLLTACESYAPLDDSIDGNNLERYHLAKGQLGAEILDTTNQCLKPKYKCAILVRTAEYPNHVYNIGAKLGTQEKIEYKVAEVFRGNKEKDLAIPTPADWAEARANLSKFYEITFREDKYKFPYPDAPNLLLTNRDGDRKAHDLGVLFTTAELGEPIVNIHFRHLIKEEATYRSALIVDKNDQAIGIYLEEEVGDDDLSGILHNLDIVRTPQET